MQKRCIYALYTLIVVCIGLATVIEKYQGTAFVGKNIYGSWWFSALWALLTVVALAYIMKQRLYKRTAVLVLHLSFVVILAGALTTHLFSRSGTVRLRKNVETTTFVDNEDSKNWMLPFSLTLKEFRIVNYPGTDAPLDYQSIILFSPASLEGAGGETIVSMNNIGHIDGYRLFQQSYDSDGEGVTLGISYDPCGIAITYFGYLLLLAGIIATLLSRKTQMRALYKQAITAILLLVSINASAANELQTVDKDIAHRMGTINVLYNNRICPLNTASIDFVTKLTGSASWNGYSADEIFMSWMIYYSPWEQQKLIRIKSRYVQQLLGIDSQWASYSDFINEHNEYKLKDFVNSALSGFAAEGNMNSALGGFAAEENSKALMEADEKYHLIEMFYRGQFLKIFPLRLSQNDQTTVNWYSPGGQTLPREIPVNEQFFIKQAMDFLTESIVTGQHDRAMEIIAKIKLFQRDMIGDLLPSDGKTKAELFYNTLRTQKWTVFLALTLSLLLCMAILVGKQRKLFRVSSFIFNLSLFIFISLQLALRWWLGGHIPVSNGPETMLFMAWVLLLLTMLLSRKIPIITGFGPLMASFCMLVAMLGGTNSQLTPLMPVLQSPLLSVHVMTVMCAYAIFALQMLIGIHALILMRIKKLQYSTFQLSRATALSQLLLYPAVFLLAIGIFLGAVWANVSWGNYWSWDPKESWALITLMVYAVPLHKASIGSFSRPRFYHIYMVSAFLAVLITYFGVNFLLGGMHSYA